MQELVNGTVIGEYSHAVRLTLNGETVLHDHIYQSDIVTTMEDAVIAWAKQQIATRWPKIARQSGKTYEFDVEYLP